MMQSGHGGDIAARASRTILCVVSMLAVLQSLSTAQDQAAYKLAASASQPTQSDHDASIRDIGPAGSRNIGCPRGLGSQYSPAAQMEIGRAYAHDVEVRSRLVTDPAINEYVNRIGQNLARNSDAQFRLTFKIIDTSDVNALSLPGGFIYVDSGLILAADNEAELAGVIAHEIAHVAACHAAQAMARDQLTDVASMPRIFRFALRRITLNTIYRKPTQSFESEADFLAIEYLYKSGYDPQAMTSFLKKVETIEKQMPAGQAQAFESHRQTTDRIEKTQREIHTHLPPTADYKQDTLEFHEIQQRLSELEKGHQAGKIAAGIARP